MLSARGPRPSVPAGLGRTPPNFWPPRAPGLQVVGRFDRGCQQRIGQSRRRGPPTQLRMPPADSKSLLLSDWRRTRMRRPFASPGYQPAERRQQVLRRLRPLWRARLATRVLILMSDCWIVLSQMPSYSKEKVVGYSFVVSTSISQPSCRPMVPMLVSVSLSIGRLVLLIRVAMPIRRRCKTSRRRLHLLHVGREAYSPRPLYRSSRLFARMKRGTTNYP